MCPLINMTELYEAKLIQGRSEGVSWKIIYCGTMLLVCLYSVHKYTFAKKNLNSEIKTIQTWQVQRVYLREKGGTIQQRNH